MKQETVDLSEKIANGETVFYTADGTPVTLTSKQGKKLMKLQQKEVKKQKQNEQKQVKKERFGKYKAYYASLYGEEDDSIANQHAQLQAQRNQYAIRKAIKYIIIVVVVVGLLILLEGLG
ncbi:hypothetical protein [Streptococcus dentiloxodontae]